MVELEKLVIEAKEIIQAPFFPNRAKMSELDGMAQDALSYDFEFGHLGAVLIFQQLTEEIVYSLLNCINVFLKTRIYPYELKRNYESGQMLGLAIKELGHSIEFENKDLILSSAREINRLRNKIVHKLLEKDHLNMIRGMSVEIKEHFERLFNASIRAFSIFNKELNEFIKENESTVSNNS
jgi:hypothetical protein